MCSSGNMREEKKKSLQDQTHFCVHELRKHTIEMAEELLGKAESPSEEKKSLLSSEEVWAHDKLWTMLSSRDNSSDPLYRLPILLLVLLEARVWEHRQATRGDKDMNVRRSSTNVPMHAFFFCIHAFIISPAWADVMQGLSACNNTLLQFPLQPAVKKQRLCASTSLPGWLFLWKVNKLVCSGTAPAGGGEHKSYEEEEKIIRSWQEVGLGEGAGTEDGRMMNSGVRAWAIHCPPCSPPPFSFPSNASLLSSFFSLMFPTSCKREAEK